MKINITIIAGGFGTRLWPASRASLPKQFLSFDEQYSLFQSTINRVSDLDIDSITTVCNENHRFFVAEQLENINKKSSIILEPESKNTAPAIAMSALNQDDEVIMLVMPADHVISDSLLFNKKIKDAIDLASSGKLVTFGIIPRDPNTGYGYIERGSAIGNGFSVNSFKEKPDYENAKEYIESGNFYWNSGIFLFKKNTFLDELKIHSPKIFKTCNKVHENRNIEHDFIWLDKKLFKECPTDSIDYAVMENTSNAAVIPVDLGWNDLGSWESVWENSKKDKNKNHTKGDVIIQNTSGSYVSSENQLITVSGVDNLIVVATKDSILVCNKNNSQDVKEITEVLKKQERTEYNLHRQVQRPWGSFDSLESEEGYQVKNISVKPGAKLSVQSHKHRAEHWIVVAGQASVTIDDKTFILNQYESTYIPLGSVHSLENLDSEVLKIIEVQCGKYLGEDDIVRYDDIYGRAGTNK
jgi:mannose-1-phosphate guanylyltransferase